MMNVAVRAHKRTQRKGVRPLGGPMQSSSNSSTDDKRATMAAEAAQVTAAMKI